MTSDNALQRGRQATGTTSDNATPSRPGPVARDYQDLRERVDQCDTLAADIGHDRGRRMLRLLAERARGVLAVIDAEPGLHTHLERLPYGRAVAVLAELIRQAYHLIRTATWYEANGVDHPRRNTALVWDEAEALTRRADELAGAAVAHPPRLRLDTVAGSHAMSRRLIDVHPLDEAADTIDAVIAAAGRLAHPDPAVTALAGLAASLREQTTALRATTDDDWWTGYFDRAHRAQQAAWEQEQAESDRLYAAAAAARGTDR